MKQDEEEYDDEEEEYDEEEEKGWGRIGDDYHAPFSQICPV